jgi:hypothetical protein
MANTTDYFLIFTNAAAAQADATVGTYWDAADGVWRQDVCFPGAKVITAAALVHGISPLTGFWIMIATVGPNAVLDAHANLVLKLDRDVAAQGGSFVLSAAISGTNRTNATISLVPHGSNYPHPLGQ